MVIDTIGSAINELLGLNTEKLSLWQMGVRAAVVYIVTLGIVRLGGNKRFLGKHAIFDVTLSIIFGATLSRAINGSAPFFPTLGAGVVLMGIHWVFATIAFHAKRFERLIKGKSIILVRDGKINRQGMRAGNITYEDLLSSLRLQAKIDDYHSVKIARLESNGDISVILQEESPQIVEFDVSEAKK
ncbi:DUF421 domain-containing protein [Mastigocoleus testarum]|uniref:YetF C-terminal domain-containing protein n=1 Tax=Mastigocoleus testarum BC008 TaxID=371196 RepID=A0A0V7ZZI8_9CYAN|nr:YetF domain-containing protein [Mastigocoleus testarum]KST69981.1 hypothetical protein BC008_05960 [Mastigocoleus testarum BC008]